MVHYPDVSVIVFTEIRKKELEKELLNIWVIKVLCYFGYLDVILCRLWDQTILNAIKCNRLTW